MMFSRIAAFTLVALPLLAVATPLEARTGTGNGKCSTGPVQCCNTVQNASALPANITEILSLLPINLGANVPVGLGCTPISVVGVLSGNACSANAVCCKNNAVGGVASIGCVPVSL